jgi:hypothetical protein
VIGTRFHEALAIGTRSLIPRRVHEVLAIGTRSSIPCRVYEALAIGTRSSKPYNCLGIWVHEALVVGTRFHNKVLVIGTLLEGGQYSDGTMSFQRYWSVFVTGQSIDFSMTATYWRIWYLQPEEPRASNGWQLRIRIEGNARVLENSIRGHYKGYKTLGVSGKGVSWALGFT